MLKYITRGNTLPDGKLKIYFSCHPDDFDKYFNLIAKEILSRLNCAIFYYTDEAVLEEERLLDISQMQLLVIPVTARLLLNRNDTIEIDLPLAQKLKMPILPLMQESGLEKLFSEKFGELQFLDKTNLDKTAISYSNKLTNFLSALFLNETLIKQVRQAFDAYIFLSYRKKDRKYANELMHLIHKNDFSRSIAIWYDEYLTPGENFNSSIKQAIEASNLFSLLVTPNLNETGNYVLREEYPLARSLNKKILPIEMVETDKNLLAKNYIDVGEPINIENINTINEAILQLIMDSARVGDNSPEHNFFLGLAYLNGIDVELNREYAFNYIKLAAEASLQPAIKKLVEFYNKGICIDKNIDFAIIWQRKLINLLKNNSADLKAIIEAYWDLSEIYEERNDNCVLIKFYNEFLDVFNEDDTEKYIWDYIRIKIKLAHFHSKIDEENSQRQSLTIYYDTLKKIISKYDSALDNLQLEVLANFIENFAMFLINKSRRFDDDIDTSELVESIKSLRRSLEAKNNISYEMVFEDSIFHKANVAMMQQWFNCISSGFYPGFKSAIKFDAETDFTSTNPLVNAEELLFLSLGILEYLGRIDIEKYGLTYSKNFEHIAQLHLAMGFIDRAIETFELNIAFLKKFQNDFYIDLTKQLVSQYNSLGEAYSKKGDLEKSNAYLSMAADLLSKKVKESPQYLYELALVYFNASNFYKDTEKIEVLINSKDIMERFIETEFRFDEAEFQLIAIYCEICKIYTQPQTWDYIEAIKHFDRAIRLCQKHMDANKIKSNYYACKLHNIRIFLEDCKSPKSRDTVIKLFSISFNNCEALLKEDSEYAYFAYDETISHLRSFYHYVENYFTGDDLDWWFYNLSQVLAVRLNNIEGIESINFVPHNYRIHFSDYDLLNGNVNFEFINNYKSILYFILEIFIEKVYKQNLLDKSFDLKSFIDELYTGMIENESQGYAKQLFSIEREKLLKMF